jgi:hypothetical protein
MTCFACPWCGTKYDIPYCGGRQPCNAQCRGGRRGARASLLLPNGTWIRAGDEVTYLYTEGGGGGKSKRPNPKTRIRAVVEHIGPKAVLIATQSRSTWVRPENLR